MSVPDEYYIIMPEGAFSEIQRMLKGKTVNIPESIRERIDKYLVDEGEWTDVNQLRKKTRDYRLWTIGGVDHVIVERV